MGSINLPGAKYFVEGITWRPGVPSAGNHVATFAEAIAIFQALPMGAPIICDGSIAPLVIPNSTDFDCLGRAVELRAGGPASITIDDGATAFRNFNTLSVGQSVQLSAVPTAWSPIRMEGGFSIVQVAQGGAIGFGGPGATACMIEAGASTSIIASLLNGSINNSNEPTFAAVHVAAACVLQMFVLQTFAGSVPETLITGEPSAMLFAGQDSFGVIPNQTLFLGTQMFLRLEKSANLEWSYGDTASRPSNPVTGQIYLNTQTQQPEYFDGAWINFRDFSNASALRGWGINNTAPNAGEALVFDGSEYVPTAVGGGGGDATSIRGNPVAAGAVTTPGAVYASNGSNFVGRRLTLDDIDPAFNITSFSGGNQTVEVGDTISSPVNFTAAYTSTPTSAQIQDDQGNPALPLVSPFTSGSYAHSYAFTANNQAKTWTLTAIGATTKTATNTAVGRPRVFYGNAVPAVYNEAFIEGLASSALAANRNRSIAYNATGAQKAYYAIPSSYGTPTFTVNGFPAAFSLVATVSVTNAFGFTQNYDLWASDLAGLGSFTAVVT